MSEEYIKFIINENHKIDDHNEQYIPLCDLLKRTGVCQTGGHAKSVIADGFVKVDGKIETRKRCKIRIGKRIEFDLNVIIVE